MILRGSSSHGGIEYAQRILREGAANPFPTMREFNAFTDVIFDAGIEDRYLYEDRDGRAPIEHVIRGWIAERAPLSVLEIERYDLRPYKKALARYLLDVSLEMRTPLELVNKDGGAVMLHRRIPGYHTDAGDSDWRLTHFARGRADGWPSGPSGHSEGGDPEEYLTEALADGYTKWVPGAVDAIVLSARRAGNRRRAGNPMPPSDNLASDPGWLYHATNLDNARDILADGQLKTHKPWHGTDQETWPDGSTDRRSYWSERASAVWAFAPEGGRPVVLRTRRTGDFRRESTGDIYTRKPVAAEAIEILTDDGWALLEVVGR